MLYLPQVTSSINEQSVWGALFIGSITNAVLFGIFCLQCYTFLQRWRRENRKMVYSVVVLLLLNIFHLVTVCDLSYFYMVKYFGQDKFALLSPPWSGPTVVLLTGTIDTFVASWFIYRIWILSQGNHVLVSVLFIESIAFWAFSTACSLKYYGFTSFAEYPKASWIGNIGLGIDVLANTSISLSLCYYLRKLSSTEYRYLRSIAGGLMVYTINTGLFVAFGCLASLLLQIFRPDDFIHVGAFFILSSIYSNALLCSFNARDWVRSRLSTEVLTVTLPPIVVAPTKSSMPKLHTTWLSPRESPPASAETQIEPVPSFAPNIDLETGSDHGYQLGIAI